MVAAIIAYFASEYTYIPLINLLFYSNTNADVLYNLIKPWFPDNFKISDIITSEILMPAWNINSKKPVFFSKYTNEMA